MQEVDGVVEDPQPQDQQHRGRPGMNVWVVVLLAAFKQELNCTYDRLATMANQMGILRLMMGTARRMRRSIPGRRFTTISP